MNRLTFDFGAVAPVFRITEAKFTNKKFIDICAGTHCVFMQQDSYSIWYLGGYFAGVTRNPVRLQFGGREFDKPLLRMDYGWDHGVFIENTKMQRIWVVGENETGQLGTGDDKTRNVPVEIMFFHDRDLRVKDMACGWVHTVYLTTNGHCYCAGGRSALPIFTANKISKKSVNAFVITEIPLDHITSIAVGSRSCYFVVSTFVLVYLLFR
jgi:alpha-tubulin suppressor-like RCC1 family protein